MSQLRVLRELTDFPHVLRQRRIPAQARSRQRVQRLLDTADALIGSDGLGALTIPLLANGAHLPIGSIYQFFPDKSAIVDAVAARYIQLFLEELHSLSGRIATLRWDSAVDTVIEHFADMYRRHPTFRELWLNGLLSREARDRGRASNDELADVLAAALKQRPEFSRARRLNLASRVAVEVADGLLRYAFTLDPAGDQATINELKRMVSGYLLQFATHRATQVRRRAPSA